MLPVTAAGGPYVISSTSSSGASASLQDVLFGDVYLCGGQSNMQFTVASMFNGSTEIANANAARFRSIRLFTVGEGTNSATPLRELATIAQKWVPANSSTVGVGTWSEFSAVCWMFGRNIFDALGGAVPIGLLSDNWGGTPVQAWSSPAANAACNNVARPPLDERLAVSPATGAKAPGDKSALWNAMIVPYTTGPMALKGFTWFQAESDVGREVS